MELDPAARRDLLTKVGRDDAVYTDPPATVRGREDFVTHIGGFQQIFDGAHPEVTSGVDEYGHNFRFGWAIVDRAGTRLVEGVDFGKLGEMGASPSPASSVRFRKSASPTGTDRHPQSAEPDRV